MSSKLDFLSKYTDNGSSGGKKKKKKKKRKLEQTVVAEDLNPSVDDLPVVNWDHDDDEHENDSDGPVIVDDTSHTCNQSLGMGDLKSDNGTKVLERVPTRPRYDSDENGTPPSRRRYDSDNERTSQSKRNKRYDSDEEDRTSRKRYDSDDDDDGSRTGAGATGKRYDSDGTCEEVGKRPSDERQRYDSGDSSTDNKRRYDSDDDDDDQSDSSSRQRMSSGHKAGLQSGSNFKNVEQKIQKSRHEDAQAMVDKYGMGETIYRDKNGQRGAAPEKKRELSEAEQFALNAGSVQTKQIIAKMEEIETLKDTAFARRAGDEGIDESLKAALREGDPMAQYAAVKKSKRKSKSSSHGDSNNMPVYKGPPAKPNRFNIKPGFRWDGVDRGNGWEDKLLAQKYSRAHKAEQAHRWSTADM